MNKAASEKLPSIPSQFKGNIPAGAVSFRLARDHSNGDTQFFPPVDEEPCSLSPSPEIPACLPVGRYRPEFYDAKGAVLHLAEPLWITFGQVSVAEQPNKPQNEETRLTSNDRPKTGQVAAQAMSRQEEILLRDPRENLRNVMAEFRETYA